MFSFWVPAYRIGKDRAPSPSQKRRGLLLLYYLAVLYQLLMKVCFFVAVLKSSQWFGLRVLSFHHFFHLFSTPTPTPPPA